MEIEVFAAVCGVVILCLGLIVLILKMISAREQQRIDKEREYQIWFSNWKKKVTEVLDQKDHLLIDRQNFIGTILVKGNYDQVRFIENYLMLHGTLEEKQLVQTMLLRRDMQRMGGMVATQHMYDMLHRDH